MRVLSIPTRTTGRSVTIATPSRSRTYPRSPVVRFTARDPPGRSPPATIAVSNTEVQLPSLSVTSRAAPGEVQSVMPSLSRSQDHSKVTSETRWSDTSRGSPTLVTATLRGRSTSSPRAASRSAVPPSAQFVSPRLPVSSVWARALACGAGSTGLEHAVRLRVISAPTMTTPAEAGLLPIVPIPTKIRDSPDPPTTLPTCPKVQGLNQVSRQAVITEGGQSASAIATSDGGQARLRAAHM